MAEADDRIRLPELPVFKRYSLALRQEYAGGEEVLAMLDRTSLKVQQILDSRRAKEAERRLEDERESEREVQEQAQQVLQDLMSDEASTSLGRVTSDTTMPAKGERNPAKSKATRSRKKRKPSIIFVPGPRSKSPSTKATARKSNKKKSAKTKPSSSTKRPSGPSSRSSRSSGGRKVK